MSQYRTAISLCLALTFLAADRPEPPQVPPTPDFSGLEPVAVTKIIDGDTIRIGPDVIRLVGVQAPEGREPFGREASDWLYNVLAGEKVWLVPKEDGEDLDRYNRRLCYVYRYPDGLNVCLELVRQGQAEVYRRFPCAQTEAMLAWEAIAKEHRKGLWDPRYEERDG